MIERVTGEKTALSMLRASKTPKTGSRLFAVNDKGEEAGATVTGRQGEFFLLEFDEQENMTVHMQSVTSAPVARNKKVQLEAYDGENPFNDSDLPVDME